MSEELRHITIDDRRYAWRITHRHEPADAAVSSRHCVDRFLAYVEGTSGAALLVEFRESAAGGPESINRHGVVVLHEPAAVINLHQPRVAAALIRHAIARGWNGVTPLSIDDGFAFLSELSPQGIETLRFAPGGATNH